MAIYRGIGGTGDSSTGEDVFGDNSSITSLNGISGAIQTPTYIKFSSTANHTANQGELTWNSTEGTLDLGLNHGGVVLQIGQEQHYRVTNQSGADIPNGTLVSFVGTTGNSGKLLVAKYNGTQASKTILGLSTELIHNGSNGYVTCFGKVRGIQTNGANYGETWVDGDILYPSPTGLTKVLPQAPAAKQPIAVVINAHGSNGELFVRVQNSTTLGEDELVQLSSLTNNDILQYDAVDGRFENRSLSSAGIQPTLVSGTNIKTINSESLLGSTDIAVTTAADIANMLETTDIGVSVQGYDANTAKYNDVTANFTGTLQNGGSNVVVDSDIGSSVLAYDSNLQSFVNTFTLPTTDGTIGQVLTTDGAGVLSFASGGGGVADGDKGDIAVSSGGTVWTVDNSVVTYAKIQNVSATDRILGRSSAGAGVIQEITCTAAGRNLLDDVDAAAQRNTLGLGTLATQNGTFSGTSSGTNTGDQNIFQTIAVSGQSNVVAESTSDTLNLVAGTNVTITTNATTDTITFNASAYPVTSDTVKNSTSGTTVDFTGIPSWVKRITVMFNGVSTNGTSNIIIQLGDSGGIETTGYLSIPVSSSGGGNAVSNITTGIGLTATNAAGYTLAGACVITNITGNAWVAQGNFYQTTSQASSGNGSKTLSAVLDRIRITTVNGTDTFDAGTINIIYE